MLVLALLAFSGCAGAKVNIESTERGASVFVDDSAVGITPWKGFVETGLRRITVEKQGFADYTDTLPIEYSPLRTVVAPLAIAGGLGLTMYSIYGAGKPSLLLMDLGLGSELTGLLLIDFMVDMKIKAQMHPATGVVASPRTMHYVGNERIQSGGEKKLYHTDSVCFDERRNVLWTHDPKENQQRPFSMSAVQRCDPRKGEKSSRPSYLNVWGASTLGLMVGVVGYSAADLHSSDILPLITGCTLGGALVGWYVWAHIPDLERCEQIEDAVTIRQWAMQNMCYPGRPNAFATPIQAEPLPTPLPVPAQTLDVRPTTPIPQAESGPTVVSYPGSEATPAPAPTMDNPSGEDRYQGIRAVPYPSNDSTAVNP